jgi:hypothetical protein
MDIYLVLCWSNLQLNTCEKIVLIIHFLAVMGRAAAQANNDLMLLTAFNVVGVHSTFFFAH